MPALSRTLTPTTSGCASRPPRPWPPSASPPWPPFRSCLKMLAQARPAKTRAAWSNATCALPSSAKCARLRRSLKLDPEHLRKAVVAGPAKPGRPRPRRHRRDLSATELRGDPALASRHPRGDRQTRPQRRNVWRRHPRRRPRPSRQTPDQGRTPALLSMSWRSKSGARKNRIMGCLEALARYGPAAKPMLPRLGSSKRISCIIVRPRCSHPMLQGSTP